MRRAKARTDLSCSPLMGLYRAVGHRLRGRQTHRAQPEIFNALYDTDKIVELDRFADIAIGVKTVGALDIFLRLGSRQDHDRDPPQFLITLDFQEKLPPVFA